MLLAVVVLSLLKGNPIKAVSCRTCRQTASLITNEMKGSPQFQSLPVDCWKECLRFISTPRDISHFRLISRRHSVMYDELMNLSRTCRLDQALDLKMAKRRCGFITFPGGSLDLNGIHSTHYLWRLHGYLLKKPSRQANHIVCGLDPYSKQDFLSVVLRLVSEQFETDRMLLLCTFNASGMNDAKMYLEVRSLDINAVCISATTFGLQELNTFLSRGNASFTIGGLPRPRRWIWSMITQKTLYYWNRTIVFLGSKWAITIGLFAVGSIITL